MRLAISLIAATSLLSGCMVAQGYSEKEQSIVDRLDGGQYQPASRTARDNIETQNTLAQATFWSREAQLNPADLEAAIKLTSAVRRMGNASQAVDIAQMARQMHPRDPYLLAEYAASLIADERGTEAMKPLQEGLRSTPAYGRLWSLMGAALDQQERYADARRHYDRALQITPNDPNVLANMGLSFALEGDAATAEKWLRRAAAQPGAGSGVAQNLDLVLQLQGKPTSQMAEAQAPVRPRQTSQRQQRPPSQSAQHPTWSRASVQGPGVQTQSSQSPFAPQGQRAPVYGRQNQVTQGQLSNGQNFSVGNGAPRSAMDAARMAARQGGGRTATVPIGQDVPRSSVLVQNGGGAPTGPQMGTPQGYSQQGYSQQGYSGQQMAPTGAPQGYAPQGYGTPQYPAGAYNPQQAGPQQAPQRRRPARRR